MPELAVREFGQEQWPLWDRFVSASPQGNIFSETLWLRALDNPFRLFACYKGGEMVGGVAVLEDEAGKNTRGLFPLTPFQGILFRDHAAMKAPTRDSLEMQIAGALLDELEARYQGLTLANHYTFHDLRPFFFRSFGTSNEYGVIVRYTHVVDLRDPRAAWSAMDESTQRQVRKAEKGNVCVQPAEDFERFEQMHRRTFERQGIAPDLPARLSDRVYRALRDENRCRLYLASDPNGVATSGILAIWDSKRAYYLMGASEPEYRNNGSASLAMWTIFQDLGKPEIDLVGSNSPKRGAFKAGFGGRLRHYFVVSLKRVAAAGH